MNQSPQHLIKLLEKKGFLFKRSKGSHQIFYNSATNITVIVPVHGSKDVKKGTFLAIIKQAGIDKRDV
ncbi:type II toxin-antitoxin system HicA family toxin [Ferruginibacter sp.]|jgi:predicted RNA binding protein YcfA (HicA-like mRNA interferase family)